MSHTFVAPGVNGCVFAYGQTGSGKSHTMFGASNDLKNAHLIVRPCCHLALLDDTNWVRTEASNANGTALTSWPMQALRKAEADNLTCSLFNLDEVPGRGVTVMRVNT